MSASRTPIAILGAGPAGLGAAYRMARRSLDVTVFERGAAIGGNAEAAYDVDKNALPG